MRLSPRLTFTARFPAVGGERGNNLFCAIPADSGMAVISFSSPRRWRGELLHIIGVFLPAGKGALCGEPYLFYILGALFAVIPA